jgi:hypothetical protein
MGVTAYDPMLQFAVETAARYGSDFAGDPYGPRFSGD